MEDACYFCLGGGDAKEDRVWMHEEPPKTGELVMFTPRRRMAADTLRLDRYFAQLPIGHFSETPIGRNTARFAAGRSSLLGTARLILMGGIVSAGFTNDLVDVQRSPKPCIELCNSNIDRGT